MWLHNGFEPIVSHLGLTFGFQSALKTTHMYIIHVCMHGMYVRNLSRRKTIIQTCVPRIALFNQKSWEKLKILQGSFVRNNGVK